jgi:hypothetical protein
MPVQPRIIAPAVRIRPVYLGSRWRSRSDAYQRFPLRFAWLPMELVRRHWLVSTHFEQRFASHNHRWNVRLSINARSEVGTTTPAMTHHHSQTFVMERSTFTREHLRSAVLSNILQVYRQHSELRIERQHAAIAAMLKPANRAPEPHPAEPPRRVLAPVIPAMAVIALTRIERIENVLMEPSRRQFVVRTEPPPAALAAAERTTSGLHSSRSVPEPRPTAWPVSPVDLERLTDRLMQNIDRRLVASRERNGRI